MKGFTARQRIYDKVTTSIDKGVYLWGAGTNGGWVLDFCRRDRLRVNGFVDRNSSVGAIQGIEIISPELYKNEFRDFPVLVTAKHRAGEILAENKDIPMIMSFDAYFFMKHLEQYAALEFYDDESFRVLRKLEEYMLTSDPAVLFDITCHDQYFALAPFFNTGSEGFVDLGAYVGDTIEEFLFKHHGSFSHIWAFEPGERQFDALKARMGRLIQEWALDEGKITLENKGVGKECKTGYVTDTSHLLGMQMTETGIREVECVSLDEYFPESGQVSFIKSDIEGMEYDMLIGAEKTVKSGHPKLAISIYHKPDDLFRIYDLIKSYDPSYRFSLRSHSSLMMDTTLYCF